MASSSSSFIFISKGYLGFSSGSNRDQGVLLLMDTRDPRTDTTRKSSNRN